MSTETRGRSGGIDPGRVMTLLSKDHLGPDVIASLSGMGDAVIPVLGAIVTGERPAGAYERENAIFALGMIGRDGAVDYLRRVLWLPDLSLQVLAARALGRIGSPDALQELRRLYNGYRAPAPAPAANGNGAAATQPAPDQVRPPRWPARAAAPMPSALALELRDILHAGGEELGGDGSPQA